MPRVGDTATGKSILGPPTLRLLDREPGPAGSHGARSRTVLHQIFARSKCGRDEESDEQKSDAKNEGGLQRERECRECAAQQRERRAARADEGLVQAGGATPPVGTVETPLQRGVIRQTCRYT